MSTLELLNEALEVAKRLDYEVRVDWFEGKTTGHCMLRGKHWLMVDLSQGSADQLQVVLETLATEKRIVEVELSKELAKSLLEYAS